MQPVSNIFVSSEPSLRHLILSAATIILLLLIQISSSRISSHTSSCLNIRSTCQTSGFRPEPKATLTPISLGKTLLKKGFVRFLPRFTMAAKLKQESLLDLIQCPLCLEEFEEPRALPCLHTFCLSCLEQLVASNSQATTVKCPLCKEEHAMPTGEFRYQFVPASLHNHRTYISFHNFHLKLPQAGGMAG